MLGSQPIRRTSILFSGIALLAMPISCSKNSYRGGAGTGGFIAGEKATTTAYGRLSDGRLAYLIVTDFDTDGTVSSVSGSWKGTIDPDPSPVVTYQGSAESLTIDGVEYPFTGGRVFLTTQGIGKNTVKQIDLPFEGLPDKAELERLEKHEVIQNFLNPPTPESPAEATSGDPESPPEE